jgi:hypothetical protein
VSISHFPTFFSFLANTNSYSVIFFHACHCFSPYCTSYSVCLIFHIFSVFLP